MSLTEGYVGSAWSWPFHYLSIVKKEKQRRSVSAYKGQVRIDIKGLAIILRGHVERSKHVRDHSICLEKLRNTTKNFSQSGKRPVRDSNRERCEYKRRVPPLDHPVRYGTGNTFDVKAILF
jgi:hypothetical protein